MEFPLSDHLAEGLFRHPFDRFNLFLLQNKLLGRGIAMGQPYIHKRNFSLEPFYQRKIVVRRGYTEFFKKLALCAFSRFLAGNNCAAGGRSFSGHRLFK